MNSLAFCAVLLLAVGAMAQYRPFYAGAGVNYPRPISGGDDGLGNRFGGADSDLASRIDANGHDVKLVEDAAKLPVDQQPFWYLNREHIRKHLGLNPTSAVTAAPAAPVQPVDVVLPIQPDQTVPDPAANVA